MKHTSNFRLSSQAIAALSMLAEKLHMSKTDIVEHAIAEYSLHYTNHPLLKFAGTLSEKEADIMLNTIYSSRKNKDIPTYDD